MCMALKNASTDYATTEAMPSYLTMYIYGHCIKLISTAVHNTILTKPYRAAVIEHNGGNYHSSIMLNGYQANSANIGYLKH